MSAAAFSPDGHTLAATFGRGGGGGVLFFDVATGGDRDPLTLPYYPNGIAYARNGRRFVTLHIERNTSYSDDLSTVTTAGAGSVDLWDTASRRAVGEPLRFPAGGVYVDASDDGSRVVHGSDAGFAVVWDLEPAHWEALACELAARPLTRAEWDRYLPGRDYGPACRP